MAPQASAPAVVVPQGVVRTIEDIIRDQRVLARRLDCFGAVHEYVVPITL